MSDTVKVIIRCRPFNQKEANEGAHNVVFSNKELCTVTVNPPDYDPKNPGNDKDAKSMGKKVPRTFTFDGVFGIESKNIDIFLESFRPVIHSLMEGFNACIFAYGQTGSGKTYTMAGDKNQPGCTPNSFQFLFDQIAKNTAVEYLVTGSYIEIYNEHVMDLITPGGNLPLREHPEKGIFIAGLTEHTVQTDEQLLELMDKGFSNRSVAATKMNATSSRSHSIFMVKLECAETIQNKETIRVGRLNLVDLAGSERQGKTGAEGQRLSEANAINLSLTTLGIVIQKLVDGSNHIPYRDSVLTRLLQNSLGGNSKTLMVAAVNPASTNYDETMSTLRYADQAKKIKNKPKVNEDPKDAQIREMRDRIKKLEDQLQNAMQNGGNVLILQQIQQKILQIQPDEQLEEIEEIEEYSDPQQAEQMRILRENQKILSAKMLEQEQSTSAAKLTIQDMKNTLKTLKNEVISGKQLIDQNRERERALREARIKLAERLEREGNLRKELDFKERKIAENHAKRLSTGQEVEGLKRKIEGLKGAIKGTIQDIQEVKEEQQRFLDDLVREQQNAIQAIDQKSLLIQLFIPPHEIDKISNNLKFNESALKFDEISREKIDRIMMEARNAKIKFPRGNLVAQEGGLGGLDMQREAVEKTVVK
ncbi:Kinesin-like protein [Spironucleus salmonicida]|uniref:Kinesin-like protein n=1 Tax=Spironucleus salmonicida TaxID=348837 RepID=V6LUF5_9EUKA|nr:Kinesin-like protein [Spironucleus salmonicida]|eukprot:EST47893.1 Kinesin-2 [Spironucleus salmonicida]